MRAKKALTALTLALLLQTARAQLPLQDGYAVTTYFSADAIDPQEHRVAVFNTNDSQMVLGGCNSAVTFWRGAGTAPDWTDSNLSSVFGLTLDKKRNIFVCATRLYGGDCPTISGPAGRIYRIEGGVGGPTAFANRGTVNIFCTLPNATAAGSPGEGLGNICYDAAHNQFFVTNLDDGLIYQIPNWPVSSLPVTTWSTYNHGVAALSPAQPDNASVTFTSHKRRVWAVAMHKGRLFYSTWRNDHDHSTNSASTPAEANASNQIWSVKIDAQTGAFLPNTARLELSLPKYAYGNGAWSMPVSDICFPVNGDRVFFAERSVSEDCGWGAHESRLLEYFFKPNANAPYDWYPSPVDRFRVGEWSVHTNSCGGVSVDIQNRPWVSGDALNRYSVPCGSNPPPYPDIYGYQRFPAGGNQTALPVTSTSNLVDIDEDISTDGKTFPGSIRVYNSPCFSLAVVGPVITGGNPPHVDVVSTDIFEPQGPGPVAFPRRFVGGGFGSIDGVNANNIAASDGVTWTPLGSGTSGPVHCLAAYDDGTGPALYAGGEFVSAGGATVNNIARWDGSSWTALGGGLTSQFCSFAAVRALAVYDDGSGPALYAGGDFDHAGGVTAFGIAKWNGSSWQSVGGGLVRNAEPGACIPLPLGTPHPGKVDALMVFDHGSGPELYIGGSFDFSIAQSLSNVARWNGVAFSPLGTGVDSRVRALTAVTLTDHATIVAGGDFLNAGPVGAARVASWDPATGVWSALGSGANAIVRDLAVLDEGDGPEVFACGDFTLIGGVGVGYVAKWDGSAWSSAGFNLAAPAGNFDLDGGIDQPSSLFITGAYPLPMALWRPCCPEITITQQPADAFVTLHGSVTFTVQASSNNPLTYQWKKNGLDIPGATGSSYTIPAFRVSDYGSYAVVISNGCRWKVSSAATMYIIPGIVALGPGCSQTGPAPTLTCSAPPIIGTTVTFTISSSVPSTVALLYMSPPAAFSLPLGCGCDVYLDLFALTELGLVFGNGSGSAALSATIPYLPALVGVQVSLQGVVLDQASPGCGSLPAGLQLTNGLMLTILSP